MSRDERGTVWKVEHSYLFNNVKNIKFTIEYETLTSLDINSLNYIVKHPSNSKFIKGIETKL